MIAKGLLVAHAVLDNNKSCPCLVDSRLDLLWNRVLVDCLVRAYDVVKSLACLCYTPDDYRMCLSAPSKFSWCTLTARGREIIFTLRRPHEVLAMVATVDSDTIRFNGIVIGPGDDDQANVGILTDDEGIERPNAET